MKNAIMESCKVLKTIKQITEETGLKTQEVQQVVMAEMRKKTIERVIDKKGIRYKVVDVDTKDKTETTKKDKVVNEPKAKAKAKPKAKTKEKAKTKPDESKPKKKGVVVREATKVMVNGKGRLIPPKKYANKDGEIDFTKVAKFQSGDIVEIQDEKNIILLYPDWSYRRGVVVWVVWIDGKKRERGESKMVLSKKKQTASTKKIVAENYKVVKTPTWLKDILKK